jgi:hypothetical protein
VPNVQLFSYWLQVYTQISKEPSVQVYSSVTPSLTILPTDDRRFTKIRTKKCHWLRATRTRTHFRIEKGRKRGKRHKHARGFLTYSFLSFTLIIICFPHSNTSIHPSNFNLCTVLMNGVLEKPTVAQFVNRFPAIYVTGSSLPFSHCSPYSKPAGFSHTHITLGKALVQMALEYIQPLPNGYWGLFQWD